MPAEKARKKEAHIPVITISSAPGSGGTIVGQEVAKRRAFVRQSFNAQITDPHNYDFTINTGNMSIESAIEAVTGVVMAGLGSKD